MTDRLRGQKGMRRRDMLAGLMAGTVGGLLGQAGSRATAREPGRPLQREAPPGKETQSERLVPWMFIHSPLEQWMADYKRTFDAWAEGGVRGLVVGPLRFFPKVPRFEMSYMYQFQGARYPTFKPDPRVYKSFGVRPPPEEPRDPAKEKQLQAMLDDAASRGWEILFYESGQMGGARPLAEDPYGAVGFAAGVQDTMNAFPQAHGILLDACNEQPHELVIHKGREIFEILEDERRRFAHLGIDGARMERGMKHLRERFHSFTSSKVRYYASGGMLGALALFDLSEDTLYWLRKRQEILIGYLASISPQIRTLNRKVKLGNIPRQPALSLQTTHDYLKMEPHLDYIFPKHYFWHRGFDGLYGTVSRWVQKIAEWNPGLTEKDCFAVVKAWLGLELPGIHSVADMDSVGFPDAFFSELVHSETRRALDAFGDDSRVIAWVSTGRHPHGGDPMPGRDLHRILTASARAGLKRFVYHPDPDLGTAEWGVISGLCGKPWVPRPDGYWPPNTPRPDSWNWARKVKLREIWKRDPIQ